MNLDHQVVLEQARFLRRDTAEPVLTTRSPGFLDDWLPAATSLIVGFGIRPPSVACPGAIFAQPLGNTHVAIVSVADQPSSAAPLSASGSVGAHGSEGGALLFHMLVCNRQDYEQYLGDPFYLTRALSVSPLSNMPLETLLLRREHLPPRTIEQVRSVLRRVKAGALRDDEDPDSPRFEHTLDNSESPALLGGVQVLVDGGKLVFERPAPDQPLIEGLWTLLPYAARAKLWPATFAFSNALGFDALVVPRIYAADFEGYTNEEQAADYPAGRYEMTLQVAAETGDQRELDRLLNRRTSKDTMRLGLVLFVALIFLMLTPRLLDWIIPHASPTSGLTAPKAAAAAGMVGARDPWTACGIKLFGDSLWLKE